MDSVATKPEPMREVSVCSDVSTPEADMEALTQDVAQTQKRKGGRKPVCKIVLFCGFFCLRSVQSVHMGCRPWLDVSIARGRLNPGKPHAPPPLAFSYPIIIHNIVHWFSSALLPLMIFFSLSFGIHCIICIQSLTPPRSMLPLRNVSSATDRPRLLFENVAPNTFVNWSRQSNAMRTVYRRCNRIIAMRPMSVLCCGTRTRCWNGSYLKRV